VRAQLAVAASRRANRRERGAHLDLQRQWEDLTRFFEQAPTPIVILRGPEYMIELANDAACRVWGRTRQQVFLKPLFEVLPELRGQGFESLLAGVLQTGQPFTGRRVRTSLDRGAGLEDLYFDFVYSALRASGGRIEGIAVTAFDVTHEVAPRARELSATT
jgi:two-component system, sensor histidine kinase